MIIANPMPKAKTKLTNYKSISKIRLHQKPTNQVESSLGNINEIMKQLTQSVQMISYYV
jgi:hypothetical protein